jgi:hypothetical protein
VSGGTNAGGFATHLREAIELNRARLPRYAALTGGRSAGVSRRLILAERLALPVAWYIDRRARRFQAGGVPIAVAEFVPMSGVPEFRDSFDPPSLRDFSPLDWRALGRSLRDAGSVGGFAAVHESADRALDALEREPRFHSMVRHLLESVRRVAVLAPRHESAAAAAGLPSTRPLSSLMLRLHLLGLGPAARLDAQAAPLQAEGVPILFQDLPRIPAEP